MFWILYCNAVSISLLTTIGNEMFNTMFTTEKYFHFVLNLTVPFAVIFELPVVVMF